MPIRPTLPATCPFNASSSARVCASSTRVCASSTRIFASSSRPLYIQIGFEDLQGLHLDPGGLEIGAEISVIESYGAVTINEATVVAADIEASNGVIHVIDQVLLPPVEAAPEDIVDVAISAGDFPTLIAAVQAAGLVETLKSEGPFTVFAPTEDAFAAALEALGLTAEELLADVETLTAVLTYHVVPGKVMAGDLTGAMSMAVATVQGAEISVTESLCGFGLR